MAPPNQPPQPMGIATNPNAAMMPATGAPPTGRTVMPAGVNPLPNPMAQVQNRTPGTQPAGGGGGGFLNNLFGGKKEDKPTGPQPMKYKDSGDAQKYLQENLAPTLKDQFAASGMSEEEQKKALENFNYLAGNEAFVEKAVKAGVIKLGLKNGKHEFDMKSFASLAAQDGDPNIKKAGENLTASFGGRGEMRVQAPAPPEEHTKASGMSGLLNFAPLLLGLAIGGIEGIIIGLIGCLIMAMMGGGEMLGNLLGMGPSAEPDKTPGQQIQQDGPGAGRGQGQSQGVAPEIKENKSTLVMQGFNGAAPQVSLFAGTLTDQAGKTSGAFLAGEYQKGPPETFLPKQIMVPKRDAAGNFVLDANGKNTYEAKPLSKPYPAVPIDRSSGKPVVDLAGVPNELKEEIRAAAGTATGGRELMSRNDLLPGAPAAGPSAPGVGATGIFDAKALAYDPKKAAIVSLPVPNAEGPSLGNNPGVQIPNVKAANGAEAPAFAFVTATGKPGEYQVTAFAVPKRDEAGNFVTVNGKPAYEMQAVDGGKPPIMLNATGTPPVTDISGQSPRIAEEMARITAAQVQKAKADKLAGLVPFRGGITPTANTTTMAPVPTEPGKFPYAYRGRGDSPGDDRKESVTVDVGTITRAGRTFKVQAVLGNRSENKYTAQSYQVVDDKGAVVQLQKPDGSRVPATGAMPAGVAGQQFGTHNTAGGAYLNPEFAPAAQSVLKAAFEQVKAMPIVVQKETVPGVKVDIVVPLEGPETVMPGLSSPVGAPSAPDPKKVTSVTLNPTVEAGKFQLQVTRGGKMYTFDAHRDGTTQDLVLDTANTAPDGKTPINADPAKGTKEKLPNALKPDNTLNPDEIRKQQDKLSAAIDSAEEMAKKSGKKLDEKLGADPAAVGARYNPVMEAGAGPAHGLTVHTAVVAGVGFNPGGR